jgi:pyruvate kinase
LLKIRNFICVLMIAILPASVAADDTAAAILQGNDGVLLNGHSAPPSAALFPRDTVETQPKMVARIELTGSAIDMNPETLIDFEGDEIVLEHGSVSVNTYRAFKVRVGCLIVTPVNPMWTRYDVTDVDGKVTVAALKSDVNINSRSGTAQQAKRSADAGRVSVHEGETKSREEKCGAANVKSATAAAQDAIMNSPYAVGAALGVAGALTCWALCRDDDPISPSTPKSSPKR